MRQYIIECKNCLRHSRIEWDETERTDVQFRCPYCGEIETEELVIVEDQDYPTLDYFRRTVQINVPSWQQYDPLHLSGGGMRLRQKGKTKMKTLENLDFREKEEDSLLLKAKRILTKILGGGE